MVNKIYIAGPMTGIPQFNFTSFDLAAKSFIDDGFEVFSPASHDRELLGKPHNWLPEAEDTVGPWQRWGENIKNPPSLRQMLGDDLKWIAENATHILMLRGWENSKGARTEHALAVALGLVIWYD